MEHEHEKALPMVPISQDRLSYLIAALLVYQQYCTRKMSPSETRNTTLLVLAFLLPKLERGTHPAEGKTSPLWLTTEEVRVIQAGLATILDQLSRKPVSPSIKQEMTHLKGLKMLFEQHFGH